MVTKMFIIYFMNLFYTAVTCFNDDNYSYLVDITLLKMNLIAICMT